MKTDTIVAIATALNNSGISIIRISGDDALAIIDKIYQSKNKKKILSSQPSHTAHYGYIFDDGRLIDEVMVVLMKSPNSYTREDVVEINCHGGVVVTRKVMEVVVKNGARVAEPGEYTKRAFLNGRIDLSQAESVIDIINAKNEYALDSSIRQLKGTISIEISNIRSNIIRDVAFIEAALDDPEHINIDNFSETLSINVKKNISIIQKLLQSSDTGRLIKEGIQTVILGKPNAGKSSLLNTLLGEDRAIVTDIEGTTRDILEETINIQGIMLNVIDTAGIRETQDIIEKIGVSKAKNQAQKADLILYVVDGSKTIDSSDTSIIEFIKDKKAIVLVNKSDLELIVDPVELEKLIGKKVITISAKEKNGMDELESCIKEMFFDGEISFNDEIYLTNLRHKAALMDSLESLIQVEESIKNNMPEDFYSIDLMNAYEVLGEIIGETVGEDLINKIFSEFCMGK